MKSACCTTLKRRKRLMPPRPRARTVAITLGNLGMAYGELGDAAKKREYVTRTLKIFEGAYGPDHPHATFYREELAEM